MKSHYFSVWSVLKAHIHSNTRAQKFTAWPCSRGKSDVILGILTSSGGPWHDYNSSKPDDISCGLTTVPDSFWSGRPWQHHAWKRICQPWLLWRLTLCYKNLFIKKKKYFQKKKKKKALEILRTAKSKFFSPQSCRFSPFSQ